jgi:hypothetical protein
MPDPTPLSWTVRHRLVSLSFLVGLFKRLQESLSDSSVATSGLTSCLKAQSKERESFFKDVISYANEFLDTHKAQFDNCKADAKVISRETSIESSKRLEPLRNSSLAGVLANLVKDEIFAFFKTLLDPRVVKNEEARYHW